jgi:hypothetical protein
MKDNSGALLEDIINDLAKQEWDMIIFNSLKQQTKPVSKPSFVEQTKCISN